MTEGNGYTQADNWLWDYVMPKALPSTFKVVSAVLRMTAGWHIESVELTFDDFQVITGIDNRGTLTNAIKDALAEGFIERTKVGKSFAYSLKIVPIDSPKIVPGAKKKSKNRTDNQSKNRTEYAKDESENRTAVDEALKEKKEKEKGKKDTAKAGNPNKPYGIYKRLSKIEPGMKKEQSLREIKLLLEGNPELEIPPCSPDDIVACGQFLQTDPWRIDNMVTLTTRAIIEKINKWASVGKPAAWSDFKAGVAPKGYSNGHSHNKPKDTGLPEINVTEKGW